MEYKLFDEYITLQALLKTTGILPSGGAIKSFLEDYQVLFNGEEEKRRGKKIRLGDQIDLPQLGLTLTIVAPSQEEIAEHQENLAEKERVAALVKQMNKQNKQKKTSPSTPKKARKSVADKKTVRFPGT